MYQHAFNEISASGHAASHAAQALSTLIHGIDADHPHKAAFKAAFHKQSSSNPSQGLDASSTTARFGNSVMSGPNGSSNVVGNASVPYFATQPHHTYSTATSEYASGVVVPTGQELSTLYKHQPGVIPVITRPPVITLPLGPNHSTLGASSVLTPSPSCAVLSHDPSSNLLSGSTMPPLSTNQPAMAYSDASLHFPATNTQLAEAHLQHHSVGQTLTNINPLHTPVVNAPVLTPMGRDLDARSGSSNAPMMLSKKQLERMQKQAAKEALRKERTQPMREKKNRSCCNHFASS